MKINNYHFQSDILANQGYTHSWKNLVADRKVHHTLTVETRKIGYQFYPHFHPFVTELLDRLIKQSIPGLQNADTEYRTLLKLSTATTITSRDTQGKEVSETLPEGTMISLADGTVAKRADLSFIKLSGNKILNLDLTPLATKIAKNELITIPQNTNAKQISFDRPINFSSDTSATLVYAGPTPTLYEEIFSTAQYDPNLEIVPNTQESPHPVKDLDFTSGGAYSVYNWEIFFHVPITIAIHLSKNQRFEDAMQWFHYIFDPADNSEGPTPERFWKVKPFQYTDVKLIEDILINLSSNADSKLKKDTIDSINAWKEAPFRPHLIARYRQSAYMFKTVMAYLDNLIAWGDSLFRQDTGESINEAAQLYILAANILGPRMQAIPQKSSVKPQTYAQLRGDLDAFGNALRDAETKIPFASISLPTPASEVEQTINLRSLGRDLYFCVPQNTKLMSYWDTVADRLFKIRNSLNIQGTFRQLPLFEPPIDPALLAKATASGLDVGAIVNGLNQPLPLVRFQVLVQKAAEICQEVKSLGNNLLSAMEKEDNEALSILRAQHEKIILGLVESVKYSQWQEAIKAREGLEVSLKNAIQRYVYYERQLGKNEVKIPELEAIDAESLGKMQFKSGEPEIGLRPIDVDIAQDLGASGGKIVSSYEATEMEKSSLARDFYDAVEGFMLTGKGLKLIPDFGLHAHFWGVGPRTDLGGGTKLADVMWFAADVARFASDRLNYEAGRAAKIGSYARREQEWAYQSNLAAGEISQIFKQLRGSQIREAMAEREWKNHQVQIKHAEEIERFLTDEKKGKKTNKDFYTWMKREVKGLYGQVFQFAFDIAKKAERALQHELGDPNLSYLEFGYLAGKEGLLAGEKLYLDIKRMEMAYHDLNRREYELTKHISLLQLDPRKLIELRTTGKCTIFLPEDIFDFDCPGHYFRRIKSVALSIPCIAGPYASANCTLTLLKSSIRTKSILLDGKYSQEGDDDRFSSYSGSLQSIVTSSGQNDSGLFETNLRDERYLPFEGSGVISAWQLALPANPSKNEPCQFDYKTISDVILHIRYTAREAGSLLKSGAIANLQAKIGDAQTNGSVRLFSIRHEFPTEWAKFKNSNITAPATTAELKLNLRSEHYPFWSQHNLTAVKRLDCLAQSTKDIDVASNVAGTENKTSLTKDAALGDLRVAKLPKAVLSSPIGPCTLYFNDNSMEDLWLAVSWGKE